MGPITETDWAVGPDTSLGIKDAVMIFEKIIMDDRDMMKEKYYYTIYRRLRILTSDGREEGDISIPLYSADQKVLSLRARTIHHDGDTVYLAEDQIVEKEVFKNRKVKIKQKSFSMPGLTDDCIIEYRIKLRLPNHVSYWNIQKNIALLQGELTWHLFYGKGLTKSQFAYMGSQYAPNYMSLCLDPNNDVEVERLPRLKETKKIVFTINNIAAFESEPHTLPKNVLLGQLHYYYTEVCTANAYWGKYSSLFPKWMAAYIDKSKKIKKIVKEFESLSTDGEKMRAAYDWVNENLINLTFVETEKKIKKKKYENADKAIKSGYANRSGITYIFCDMLREMDIDAKICRVVDRDENIFVKDAKYWQFDRMLVAVKNEEKEWEFFAPGELYIPYGQVPWYSEGISALLGGAQSSLYVHVPFSNSHDNSSKRSINLTITDEFDVLSNVHEKITGHTARSLRVILDDVKEAEYNNEIKDFIKDYLFDEEVDSITYENINTCKEPLYLKYSISFPNIENELMGDRILIKPLEYMEKISNPFVDDNRTLSIMFDYAYELHENVVLEFPDEMQIEAVPEDFMFKNQVGSCGVSFTKIGNKLSVQRIFRLDQTYFSPKNYQQIKEFFQQTVSNNDLTVSILYSE